MDCGECSIVKRHTLVTKVLRSMPMPSREVMRIAATNPARHRFTTGPAAKQVTLVRVVLTFSLFSFFIVNSCVQSIKS